jgi:hypothetical protein
MVVNMTALYVVAVLGYVLIDDSIKAARMKAQAKAAADMEADYQLIARDILRDLAKTQELQRETEKEFGDPELVQKQMDRLRGHKEEKESKPYSPAPSRQFAQTAPSLELTETDKDPNPQPGRD